MPDEPDDGWADEKWEVLGFVLKNFPVIAVVLGLLSGGLAATSFQSVGGSGLPPTGGAQPAGGGVSEAVEPAVAARAPSPSMPPPIAPMAPEEFTAPPPGGG